MNYTISENEESHSILESDKTSEIKSKIVFRVTRARAVIMLLSILGVFVLIVIYLYLTRNFDYWKKRGVKYEKPIPMFGTTFRQVTARVSLAGLMTEMYHKYKDERVVGFFMSSDPALLIRDPKIVQGVLVSDFPNFNRRGWNFNKTQLAPIARNLVTADGDVWKLLRQRITPAFTMAKLRAMFPLITERVKKLQVLAGELAAEGNGEVDVKDLLARYTTDIIGACGFGIDSAALDDPASPFRALGMRIFKPTAWDITRLLLKSISPELFSFLRGISAEIEHGTYELVTGILKDRNYKPSGRNDFIDLLVNLKAQGKMVGDSIERKKPDGTPEKAELEFDDFLIAAQVMVFFAAGYETSSSGMSITLHQLASYPEVQKKVQDEIDEVLSRHNGEMSYEAVKEMSYLEMTLSESIRMCPSVAFLIRKCDKRCTLPGMDITVDPGVIMAIPVQAIQNDPQYFEDPDEFRPERFHPDVVKNMNKFAYLPFGAGPRACIGENLGKMQSIAGLAGVLQKYSVRPCPRTVRRPRIDPRSTLVQIVVGGLPLTLTPRKKHD